MTWSVSLTAIGEGDDVMPMPYRQSGLIEALGQLGGTPVPVDAQHNVLQALVRWVKTGAPPSEVVATKYVNDTPANGVLMTRPLCPFPTLPQYTGSGDSTDAASFACVDDGVHNNPTPAPEYLKD
jgi:hypothetical protein